MTDRVEIVGKLGELFREHGYEGASLARITERTGLGKGSLYHFFPGGKEEMAEAVLAEVDDWFEKHVFEPLRAAPDPGKGLVAMLKSCDQYFRSGKRICLVGAFALDSTRDRFAKRIAGYFERWREATAGALERMGHDKATAAATADDLLSIVQGALVLSRALGDANVFSRAIKRLLADLDR